MSAISRFFSHCKRRGKRCSKRRWQSNLELHGLHCPRGFWLGIFLAMILLGNPLRSVQATDSQPATGQFTDPTTEYVFGQVIHFHIQIQTEANIASATITIQPEGNAQPSLNPASVTPVGENTYHLDYSYPVIDQALRAFSYIHYSFVVTLATGEVLESQEFRLYYEDNRVEWQTLEVGSFRIHWYTGDLVFAGKISAIAQDGWKKIHTLLDLPTPGSMDIYIYADSTTMQDTLNSGDKEWVAGHADPDLQAFSVALPPGPEQEILAKQRIPHELMHLMLYQKMGAAASNLPKFLSEGLASNAELYPSPDYQLVLESAYQKRSLLAMNSLCQAFPRDASNALLAYAQSASFVNYLYRSFGTDGLQELIDQYVSGMDCEPGIQAALGQSLEKLESAWRQDTFGENALSAALMQLLPWLIILAVILAAPLGVVLSKVLRKKHSTIFVKR